MDNWQKAEQPRRKQKQFSRAVAATVWLILFAVFGGAVNATEYAVVVSKSTATDTAWKAVIDALVDKHDGRVIQYIDSVDESLGELAKMQPRYTCFVTEPADAGRAFVANVHRLTRAYDDDPWCDTIWGILTGFDAANALRIARHTEPLTVRKVAAGTEVALGMVPEGLWYDELVQGKKVEKKLGAKAEQSRGPDDTTRALADTLTEYDADLFVTSGHATERDWMIGFTYRNGFFKSSAGKMFGETTAKKRFPIVSNHARVYLPIGNCLMGHVDGPDAMALAWMNSVGVKQMIGYTVPTWYGYAGWGLLDYFVEQPGRYSLAEAFIANQQALLHRLYAAAPQSSDKNPPPGSTIRVTTVADAGKALGVSPRDVSGLMHDRDVVAFYGDPGWHATLADGPVAYEQNLTVSGNTYTFTVTPRRGSDSFKPVNTNGAQRGWRPIVQWLPHRVKDIRIISGDDLQPLVADDFILVPNPRDCEPDRRYRVVFQASAIE